MFVRDCMSKPAITVTPETSFQVAFKMMEIHKFRRLPVVDRHGHLAGIVSERDLLYAAPSPASSLSMWEMNYLLTHLTINQIMSRSIIITTPETPVEHAASLMVANKIGGLPVIDDHDRVVGIITETDIFKVFVNVMDSGEGVRLTLKLPAQETLPFAFIQAVYQQGGELATLGSLPAEDDHQWLVLVLHHISLSQLQEPLQLLREALVSAYQLPDSYYSMPLSRVEPRHPHPV